MTTTPHSGQILAVNVGSSSIKLTRYPADDSERGALTASVERIGTINAHLILSDVTGVRRPGVAPDLSTHHAAFDALVGAVQRREDDDRVAAIGHRIVHGGPDYSAPCLITDAVVDDLRDLIPIDPDHLPQAIAVIEAARRRFPDVPQIACFDTAFHRTMPPAGRGYPLPRRFARQGIVRYGFHGLSCEYVVDELRRLNDLPDRLVIAHLGSGASLTAVKAGQSVETTMGYSPTGGIMMGTRTGDLDPGALLAILQRDGLDAAALSQLVNEESGLLGVSGRSADMRDLLDHEHDDDAVAAVALFVHLARKALGGLVAVLGGLDMLVFTGGMGEHAVPVRERICAGFSFIGLSLDDAANQEHGPIVSADHSTVTVRVIGTDENLVIARHTRRIVNEGTPDVPV